MSRLEWVVALVCVAGCAPAEPDSGTPMSSPRDSADLYGWLVENEVAVGEVLSVDLGAEHQVPQDPSDRRKRIGYALDLDATIQLDVSPADLRSTPIPLAFGAIRGFGTGFVYTAVVESPGAEASRLHLTDLFLPSRASLYVYDGHGQVAGPYVRRGPSGNGEVWTPTQSGDRLYLTIVYDGADTARALAGVRAKVAQVGHVGSGVVGRPPQADEYVTGGRCGTDSCIVNSGSNPGIGYIEFVSGAFIYMCSGGLVGATNGDETFLTAHHCISKAGEASTMDVWFNYTGSTACTPSGGPDVSGATILAADRRSDYSLLRLSTPAPGTATALDFNATDDISAMNNAPLHRHSHPWGASQSYSTHDVDTAFDDCNGWPRGEWIYSQDDIGATMEGSSGSPVLDAAGRVVGQLSGGCGYNLNDVCDTVSNRTVDGALYAYYPQVAAYLDPEGPNCPDADSDGHSDASCGGTDCNDGDPGVNPDVAEACADGIDNDCDTLVDGADPECGTCSVLPTSVPCLGDTECCSGECGWVCGP